MEVEEVRMGERAWGCGGGDWGMGEMREVG